MQESTNNKPTYVTMPSLASLDDFTEELKKVWESGILTHNGPIVQQLEKDLCAKLNLKNMIAVINGTIALQMPFKAFRLKGEVITTPFSWVATCSSIIWEDCVPVFVDIDPNTFNIDASKIEDAITHRTCAIMPVHVFSNPCDVESIDEIAKRRGIKVIYDAAHALFVDYKGKSLLEYGDVSATSFHATKIWNTGEGGGLITTNDELHEQLKRIRFFGYNDKKEIVEDGFNGKMTEIHAALGMVNLKIMDEVLQRRKQIFHFYKNAFIEIDKITFQSFDEEAYNYSYMPIVFEDEATLMKIDEALKKENVFARRYFYPSLNNVQVLSQYTAMPVSESLASRILCLPSHQRLEDSMIEKICSIIKSHF